jgi:MinD superfamily P-loop ATPase
VCETSCLVTCPCFYVSSVFCLQPRKCKTCQVCLMFTFSSDTILRQSHFNGNMDDQRRQNISLSNSS